MPPRRPTGATRWPTSSPASAETLKPATVEQTSYVVLDTMGAIAGGMAEPEMQKLAGSMLSWLGARHSSGAS